jgi:hypothetical protein
LAITSFLKVCITNTNATNRPNHFFAHAAALALAAFFACSVLPAAADDAVSGPATAPITIDHCSIDKASAVENPRVGLRTSFVNGIAIGYTNERDAAATEIHFSVRYAGKTLTFVDRGTFGPHAKVEREFTKFSAVYSGSPVECRAVSASFADGSRWDAPDQTPSPAPPH